MRFVMLHSRERPHPLQASRLIAFRLGWKINIVSRRSSYATADDIPVANSTERPGGEIKRRIEAVRFEHFLKLVAVIPLLPNEVSILRLVGAILMARTEDWTV